MTMPSFIPLSGAEPDEVDLELLAAGALSDGDAERVRQAVSDDVGALSAAQRELERMRAEFSAHALPLPVARSAPELPTPANRPRWSGWVAAAVLAVGLAAGLTLRPDPGETPSARSMGGALPVEHWVVRDGAPQSASARPRPGDLVDLRVALPEDGHVAVVWLGADGSVEVLQRSAPERALHRGTVFSLDGAVALEDTSGEEWIVLTLTPEPLTDATLAAEVEAMRADVAAGVRARGWWALEVGREH